MAATVLLGPNELLGDLFRHNIAVQIECDPDSMPGVTMRAYSRLSPVAIAVVSGVNFVETLARLHEAVLGDD